MKIDFAISSSGGGIKNWSLSWSSTLFSLCDAFPSLSLNGEATTSSEKLESLELESRAHEDGLNLELFELLTYSSVVLLLVLDNLASS